MKFNFGHWLLLPGTEAVYLVSVVDVAVEPGALVVSGYSHRVRRRGDLLGGTIITARFTSPMPGVIRVQLAHFKGRQARRPGFDLDYRRTNPSVSTGRDETAAWLDAGGLRVRVALTGGEWGYTFERDGKTVMSSPPGAVALLTRDGETYLREQLSLQVGEKVYGLGEHFGPLVKNGQSIDMWNEDGGTDSEWAYKNVPFYLTSRGYGVLVNHTGRVSFEIGSHHVSRLQFSIPGHELDYYVFGGPTPKEALDQYTALSGRPCPPSGRSACGSPPPSPPTTMRKPSSVPSSAWRSSTYPSAWCISTAFG